MWSKHNDMHLHRCRTYTSCVGAAVGIQQGQNHGEAAHLWICLSESVKRINPVWPSFDCGTITRKKCLLNKMEYHTVVMYVLAIFLIIIVLCYSGLCGPTFKLEYLTRLNEGQKVTIRNQHNGNSDIPNINISRFRRCQDTSYQDPHQKDPHLHSYIIPEVEYDVPKRLHFIWIGSQIPT